MFRTSAKLRPVKIEHIGHVLLLAVGIAALIYVASKFFRA